ncbi:MAG: hypothetical protein ACPGVZ_09440 [Myxococcota bacterium]
MAEEMEEAGTIVVVDPDTESRNDAEDLEDEFDRQVIAIDSVDFDTEASEDVLEAAVYIVCWNLGIRAGADLIEEIRSHPRLEGKCVLVAVKEPTKTVVTWAMSLGADAVCSLPYDPGEVGERLEEIENAA